jgi:ketosteroid isomerase-like protein
MKRCPLCNRNYTDTTLNFCLSDGTPLVAATDPNLNANLPTLSLSEAPTEMFPAEETASNRAAPTLPSQPTPATPPPQFTPSVYAAPHSQPANNRRKLFVWIIVAVLLIVAGVEAFLLINKGTKENQSTDRASASNTNPSNVNTHPSGTTSPLPTAAPLPKQTPTTTPTPSPSPTATPTPTPNTATAQSEVLSFMHSWAESLRRQDLNANVSLYADHLDEYYQFGSVSREQVRANRQDIFRRYSSTDVRLTNISVEIDSSGRRATVFYDNTYNWQGGGKTNQGKSHNEMILTKTGSQWLITSEKHLYNY